MIRVRRPNDTTPGDNCVVVIAFGIKHVLRYEDQRLASPITLREGHKRRCLAGVTASICGTGIHGDDVRCRNPRHVGVRSTFEILPVQARRQFPLYFS